MAPKRYEAILSKEGLEKIGTFKESTGGGTPLAKGEKLEDHPEAHRVQQPRDEDGKFTYNAMNMKPLKYGPSRGVTTPPILKGTKINVKNYDSVVLGKNDTLAYNGKIYRNGIDLTKNELINMMKEYKNGWGIDLEGKVGEIEEEYYLDEEKKALEEKDEYKARGLVEWNVKISQEDLIREIDKFSDTELNRLLEKARKNKQGINSFMRQNKEIIDKAVDRNVFFNKAAYKDMMGSLLGKRKFRNLDRIIGDDVRNVNHISKVGKKNWDWYKEKHEKVPQFTGKTAEAAPDPNSKESIERKNKIFENFKVR